MCTLKRPPGGSAVLAAIMLKLGAYGFLRFSLPIAPDAARVWPGFMIALSLIAVVYVGLGGHGAARHEEAGGLFVGCAHGFCDPGLFHLQ